MIRDSPTFDTRTGASVSAYDGQGLNFDSDLDLVATVVVWTITDALTVSLFATRSQSP